MEKNITVKVSRGELESLFTSFNQKAELCFVAFDYVHGALLKIVLDNLKFKIFTKLHNWTGPQHTRKPFTISMVEAIAFLQLFSIVRADVKIEVDQYNVITILINEYDQKVKSLNFNRWTLKSSDTISRR